MTVARETEILSLRETMLVEGTELVPYLSHWLTCLVVMLVVGAHTSEAAESRKIVSLPDGRSLSLIYEGRSRIPPHRTIVVCSDGVIDDVSNMRRVAEILMNEEPHVILDGSDSTVPINDAEVTMLYFGSPVMSSTSNTCLDRFPHFRRFVESASEIPTDSLFQPGFAVPGVDLTNGLCWGIREPSGWEEGVLRYSASFRKPGQECEIQYVESFNFSCACLEEACNCDPVFEILKQLDDVE